MGTNCKFRVIEADRNIIVAQVYSQYDGYPTGLPKRIIKWLRSGVVGNGIPSSLKPNDVFFNGASDLAVQLVIRCKMEQCSSITEPGGIYLINDSPTIYTYDIIVDEEHNQIEFIGYNGDDQQIFGGTLGDCLMELQQIV